MGNDELKHYGVKGMRWGEHQFRSENNNPILLSRKKRITKGTGSISKGSKVSSNGPVGLKDRKPVKTKDGKNDTNNKIISSLKNSGIKWDKYSKTYWYSKNGLSGLMSDLTYNLDNLKNKKVSISDVVDYFKSEYDLSLDDAKIMIQVALKSSTNKKKEQDGKPKNIQLTHSDDELQHDGIKGQKWGIRRYRNYDGTLTEAGKERYRYDGSGRDSYLLSNEELQRRIDRLMLEKKYSDLVKDLNKKPSSSEKIINFTRTAGALIGFTTGVLTLAGKLSEASKGKKPSTSNKEDKIDKVLKILESDKKDNKKP